MKAQHMEAAVKKHEDFEIQEAGLFVDASVPYVGASPDGIINCKCHGKGILEIKCPYCFKGCLLEEAIEDAGFCLEQENDEWQLKKNHAYFYQIQMQMAVTKVSYCDFVVWSQTNHVIVTVKFDKGFYDSKLDLVKHFFVYGMLPEIIGKWYTRKPVSDLDNIVHIPTTSLIESGNQEEDYTKLCCYCNEPSFGEMVCCENDKCTITWIHFDCLRMRFAPKGKWYCPSC